MALALYRKYRPATFAEVVGQDHVTQPLRTALAAGRINHAYLFSGPRGCGKTSSARIMARSLNCVEGPTPDPCGVCPSCIALAPEGPGSLDVVELDAASHGGVDDTRDLRDRAFYMPAESRYRVFIIDEAHMVSTAGFNSLLKIVEEPPEHLVFIFATTEPEKVMTTIRSRTHHYPFRLIPPATLRKLLERLCTEEHVAVEQAVFPLVIRAGGGSARDSLSILDQLLAGAGPEGVTYRHAVALLGVTDAALLDETVDALAADDGASVFGAIDKVVEAGHDPRRFAADLLQRFRDLVILAAVPDAGVKGLIDAPDDQLAAMQGQSERLGAGTLTRLAEVLHTGLTEMRGTTAPRLALELLCARMLLPSAAGGEGALVQRLERLEQAIAGGVPLAAAPPGALPSAGAPPSTAALPRAARQAAPAIATPPTPAAPAHVVERASTAADEASAQAPADQSTSGATQPVGEPGAKPASARGSSAYRRPSLRSGAGVPADQADAETPPAPPARPARPVNPELGLPPAPVLSSRRTKAAKPVAQQPPADDWLPPDAPPDEEEYGDPVPDAPAERRGVAADVAEPAGSAPAVVPQAASGGPAAPAADTGTGRHSTGTSRASSGAEPAAPAATKEGAAGANGVRPAAAASGSDGGSPASVGSPGPAAPSEGTSGGQPATEDKPATGGELGVTDARRLWPEILAAVQRRKRVTQAMLVSATLVDLKAGVLYLSFAVPSMAKRVMEPANVGPLREALKEVLGVDWAIRSDPAADGAPALRPNLSLVPSPPLDADDEAPDDYDVRSIEPPGPRAVVRDPDEAAIELLTQELGAKRLET